MSAPTPDLTSVYIQWDVCTRDERGMSLRLFYTSDHSRTVPDNRDVPNGDARMEFEKLLRTEFSEDELDLYCAENLHELRETEVHSLEEQEHRLRSLLTPLGATFVEGP